MRKNESAMYNGELVTLVNCVIYDYWKRSYIWELFNLQRNTWAYAYEYELFKIEQKES